MAIKAAFWGSSLFATENNEGHLLIKKEFL
jgi:hypothetical protein